MDPRNIWKFLLKFVAIFLLTFAILFAVLLLETWMSRGKSDDIVTCKQVRASGHFRAGLVDRLQAALRINTVSYSVPDPTTPSIISQNTDGLLELQHFLIKNFPKVHASPLIKFEVVNKLSMLYTVIGTDKTLKPFMLAAHLDVVPVEDDDLKKWQVPPFDGEVKDGYIWGRGALDVKQCLLGILESLETLLEEGYRPTRSFYIAFGHDEEILGTNGAGKIGPLLASRNVKLEFILDEGMTITDGVVKGVSKPAALIGVAEKGYMTVELRVVGTASHSSFPPRENAISVLTKAVARLQENRVPAVFGSGPEKGMFETLGPSMKLPVHTLMRHLWLTSTAISHYLSFNHITDALQRTTTAVTMISGGLKENVIPSVASAIVNHRIHPSQTVAEVVAHDIKTINDERVKVSVLASREPIPSSPWGETSFGYQAISKSILQIFPKVVVTPGTMIANTDTRHYTNLTDSIYRFAPTYMYPEDVSRIHGDNERISVENYQQTVNFFYHLFVNANEGKISVLKRVHSEL